MNSNKACHWRSCDNKASEVVSGRSLCHDCAHDARCESGEAASRSDYEPDYEAGYE